MMDLWKVTSDKFTNDTENIMRNGNVFQISNGYMGYRGTLDEFGPEQLVGITLAGMFDQVGDAWREPVNAPNGAYSKITVDGMEISALDTEIISHHQVLDLKNASFERTTVFKVNNKILTLNSKRFLSALTPNLMVVEYSFNIDKDSLVTLNTGIDYNIWDLNGPHLREIKAEKNDNILSVTAQTNELGKKLAVVELIVCSDGTEQHKVKNNYNLRTINIQALADKKYTYNKYIAVVKEGDPFNDDVKTVAHQLVNKAAHKGFAQCLAEHNAEWEQKWQKCDVLIEGDNEAQHALRYSIFQLLMVAPVKGSASSIPARALSGQVYKGAIFWDTEMFMFPFFVRTYPEKAVELLQYRINTLDGARRKAQTESIGFRGAFYAWESQETGDDACTYFNIGDPHTGRLLRTHFRDKQVHISGDVAIAMWEYFKITSDDSLLLNGGAEVILECARFYYSYAYFKKDKNRYEILDVIGPDEFHERVNNNAFTNMVAKVTFEVANKTVEYLKTNYPEKLKELIKKIDIENELPLFAETEKLLYVPQPNKDGIIEQFDAYFKLKDVKIDDLVSQKMHPDEYMGAGQGLAVPTKVIKQADVVYMLSFFSDRFSKEIKLANWKYYEPKTEHGSSLSACTYAMVAAENGDLDHAYNYFLKTAKIDLEAKYKVFVGTIFMGGSHPAANGGAWMTAIFGFAGLRTDTDKVIIDPKLYRKWDAISFNLNYKLDQFHVKITKNQVVIDALKENKSSHIFEITGKKNTCTPGQKIEINY